MSSTLPSLAQVASQSDRRHGEPCVLQAAVRSSTDAASHDEHAAGLELPGLRGGSDDGLDEAGPGHGDDAVQWRDGDSALQFPDLDLDALPAAAGLHAGLTGDTALPLLTPTLRAQVMAALWVTWEVRHGLSVTAHHRCACDTQDSNCVINGGLETSERVLVAMLARSGRWLRDVLLCATAQDPVPQTVSAVHAAFDSLMDVLEAQQALAERARCGGPHPAAAAAAAAMGGQSALAFQEAVAAELMALGAQAIPCRMSGVSFYFVRDWEDLAPGAHAPRIKFADQALSASLCDAHSAC